MSDARIEAFLADVLALEGENQLAIREGVHIALADCEQIFKAQEINRRMKDKAPHACHILCRSRVVEEMQRRKGTAIAEHLKFVLSVIDGRRLPEKDALACEKKGTLRLVCTFAMARAQCGRRGGSVRYCACKAQSTITAIQLVAHTVAISTDPRLIEPRDPHLTAIRKH
jgi:hypothetical protein